MDPEVLSDKPGSCPICGMALEPRTITLEEQANPELEEMKRRFWISLALTVPILLLAMGEMLAAHALPSILSGADARRRPIRRTRLRTRRRGRRRLAPRPLAR